MWNSPLFLIPKSQIQGSNTEAARTSTRQLPAIACCCQVCVPTGHNDQTIQQVHGISACANMFQKEAIVSRVYTCILCIYYSLMYVHFYYYIVLASYICNIIDYIFLHHNFKYRLSPPKLSLVSLGPKASSKLFAREEKAWQVQRHQNLKSHLFE